MYNSYYNIHPSIHPFIHPSIHPSIHLFIHPSIYSSSIHSHTHNNSFNLNFIVYLNESLWIISRFEFIRDTRSTRGWGLHRDCRGCCLHTSSVLDIRHTGHPNHGSRRGTTWDRSSSFHGRAITLLSCWTADVTHKWHRWVWRWIRLKRNMWKMLMLFC